MVGAFMLFMQALAFVLLLTEAPRYDGVAYWGAVFAGGASGLLFALALGL